jgi:peptidyl-dipeptidase Dcp
LEEEWLKILKSVVLNDLLEKAKPAAQKKFAINRFRKDLDGIDQLEKWDGAYYSEKLKQKLFNFDDEILKPFSN